MLNPPATVFERPANLCKLSIPTLNFPGSCPYLSGNMITKHLIKFFSAILLGTAVVISSGCGGGDKSSGSVDPAKVTELQAKIQQGDGDAAFQLGELYAAHADNKESAINAALYFTVAGGLGNGNAKAALDAINAGLTAEDKMELDRRVGAYKMPTK